MALPSSAGLVTALRVTTPVTRDKTAEVDRGIDDTPGEGYEPKPFHRDTCQLSMLTLNFRRDAAGTIAELDFSTPVLHNVSVTRLN